MLSWTSRPPAAHPPAACPPAARPTARPSVRCPAKSQTTSCLLLSPRGPRPWGGTELGP